MSEFVINARDFTSSPFSWEATIKTFDYEGKQKNYEVIDGNLVTPIDIEFKLQVYKVANLSSASTSFLNDSNNLITISEKTEEDFYKAVENNEDLLTSYLEWFEARDYRHAAYPEDEMKKDKEMFFSSATKLTKIRPFITDQSKYDELGGYYLPAINDWIVIEQEKLNVERIIEIFDNHPMKQTVIDGIKYREEEMKKLIIESQNKDRETIRRNNYETWKVLNQKFANGEFDDYII